ncbi:hypothetical protein HHK36_031163 [Tetracentron sinense]|uniref:Multidrug and toxic compound extrusion protein n=1 Tax=Tetracentron sinense TaxID=13715 RepID=A0A834YAG6_TETSI|nr:hypothetical protein HHK36_031163 [Tetracentron sinense]
MTGGELQEPLLDQEPDIEEITSCAQFIKEAITENKKLWYLAGLAIFTAIAQYSLGAITQVFAGHLTTLELDAVSTENMVIAGLAFGILLGMGDTVRASLRSETATHAGCLHATIMDHTQHYVHSSVTHLLLCNADFDVLRAEPRDRRARREVLALHDPTIVRLRLHVPDTEVLTGTKQVQLKLGLPGAAASLNISWWIVVLGQFAYIAMGYCPGAWTGFSWSAFRDLGAFARLSVASAIMMCLEFWYYMLLVVLAGRLRNAQIAVAAISICTNLNGWEIMIFLGFNAAISVRISNELGAGRPRAAKFSILVVVLSSALIGVAFLVLVLALRNVYALPFTNSPEVSRAVSQLAVIFAFSLLLNSVQPVLTGVAVGAGWQWLVAYVNVGCYYIVGLPLGFFLGAQLKMGVQAMAAESRIRKWGGSADLPVGSTMDGKSSKHGEVVV